MLQALAQTDTYLRRLNVVKEAVDDTAGAAQMVARQQLKVLGLRRVLTCALPACYKCVHAVLTAGRPDRLFVVQEVGDVCNK